jgi:hypothetical protein
MAENKLSKELLELSKKVESHIKFSTEGRVDSIIELSDDVELPYNFSCEALHPGTYKGFTIEELEIERGKDTIFISDDNFHNYEINKDHKSSRKMEASVSDVVGRVTMSEYDKGRKALIMSGQVFDKEIALKLMHGLIKYVSLRINPGRIDEEGGQTYARELKFEELSFVRAPGDPNARIL